MMTITATIHGVEAEEVELALVVATVTVGVVDAVGAWPRLLLGAEGSRQAKCEVAL
jgi:hypothetical protein